ncbi:MAG: hypothetical protein ACQETR_07250 [Thermodesulfobacteriota bacterium]
MKATHYTDIPGTEMNNDMVKRITGRVLIGKDDGGPNVDHQIKNTSDGHLAFLCLVPSVAPEM